jgi:hypothetical protein
MVTGPQGFKQNRAVDGVQAVKVSKDGATRS